MKIEIEVKKFHVYSILTVLIILSVAIIVVAESSQGNFYINGDGTGESLKVEQHGSNFIVRPVSSGGASTVIENTGGGALSVNPKGGNVGIGTSNPNYLLTVEGRIYVTGARDSNNGLLIRGNSIETPNRNVDGDEVAINYYGYNSGADKFRNFAVYNGKGVAVATFDGYTGDVKFAGKICFADGTCMNSASGTSSSSSTQKESTPTTKIDEYDSSSIPAGCYASGITNGLTGKARCALDGNVCSDTKFGGCDVSSPLFAVGKIVLCCPPAPGVTVYPCTGDDKRCDGKTLQKCVNHNWQADKVCPVSCNGNTNTCTACNTGDKQCTNGGKTSKVCDVNGQWSETSCNSNQICRNGECKTQSTVCSDEVGVATAETGDAACSRHYGDNKSPCGISKTWWGSKIDCDVKMPLFGGTATCCPQS